jgi:dTMP kinase
VGRLIVIEGLDGSGKQTLTRRLAADATAEGLRVATLGFPRYGTLYADLCRDALYGRLGDLSGSVHGTALLFALDRQAAASSIREMLRDNDIVLLDRYVSSNAAYGAARLGAPEVESDFPAWVRELEMGRFELPVPDLQLLLATPVEIAAQRTRGRAAADAGRALDTFEADDALQTRTAAMYVALAAQQYVSPWRVLESGAAVSTADLLG